MSDDSVYIEYILELLAPLGPVRARKMFGGYGLYHDALMFALVAEQQLFLKIDEQTEAQFAAAGSGPFLYQSGNKTVSMRYWSAPEAALVQAKAAPGPFVVVIDTDPYPSTPNGGTWWDVAVPEVSERAEVRAARLKYDAALKR